MIARVHIHIPFSFDLPEQESYKKYSFNYEGYQITLKPPISDARQDKGHPLNYVKINEQNSFNANVLIVDFWKESFKREVASEYDPPVEIIEKVANDFLTRARHVLNASQIKPIRLMDTISTLKYLNDDETELEQKEGYVRGMNIRQVYITVTALTKEIWDDIHSIPPFQGIPLWRSLLLDAHAVLPEIGPAIVLCWTALEVFISKTLDEIAAFKNVDSHLWGWINSRNNSFSRQPSIEEQYDFLSKHLIGKSIKDEATLWKGFKDLQKARNDFAHQGVAMIDKQPIDLQKTLELVSISKEIIDFIRIGLPKALQWEVYERPVNLEISKPYSP
jgi:hypothetical protein